MNTRSFDWNGAPYRAAQRRLRGLNSELQQALQQTDREIIAAWGKDTLQRTGEAGWRRLMRVGDLAVRAGKAGASEVGDSVQAARDHRFRDHVVARGKAALDATKDLGQRVVSTGKTFAYLFKNRETLPVAVTTVLAALVASGGPDADGGIPDLDLQFGIGAHRSIFTHSIIAGTVAEGCLYGTATLVGIIYARLPTVHDRLWDCIERNRALYLKAAAQGVSAGIAYHLLIDGTFQAGYYHDLGIAMPAYAHEAIIEANAVAEGLDVTQKSRTFRRERRV